MRNKASWMMTLAGVLVGPQVAMAGDGIDCHPDAKKVEWRLCVLKQVEYKRGMKTESREECAIDKKLDIKGCDLGDISKFVPEGEKASAVRIYAIGPADFEDAQWEVQEEGGSGECKLHSGTLESYHLTKFSDAFDKSNSERGRDFDEKLKAKGKMLLPGGTLSVSKYPESAECATPAKVGKLDAKSLTKFLFYAEASFK